MCLTTKGPILKTILRMLFSTVLFIFVAVFSGTVLANELTLPQFARYTAKAFLKGQQVDYRNIDIQSQVKAPVLGVFVTVIDEDKNSRGCWGKLYPQSELKEAIVYGTIGAIKNDYRYQPLNLSELPDMKFQISIVKKIIPVNSFRQVNPYNDGMMVQSGGKGGILMPGEARDPYYQMVQCKLKAGIKGKEPFSLFRLITDTYKE